nr:uncharacterized protein LOC121132220 [Lepeophtheirus salmonis]
MKVKLAVQLMSDSVTRSLKWGHENKISGFESEDVLVTAEFHELHDKIFDIMNSRSKYGYKLKAALSPTNIVQAEEILKKIIHMRRTGPLGLIACIYSLRHFVEPIKPGKINMQYICSHKLQQYHLEHFFAAIRQRNG